MHTQESLKKTHAQITPFYSIRGSLDEKKVSFVSYILNLYHDKI